MGDRGHALLATAPQRWAFGRYKSWKNLGWIPGILGSFAGAALRRQAPAGFVEQQGLYTTPRPAANPLIWFHANTAGECVLCLPLIHRVVVEYNEKVLILVTVRCEDTLALLRSSLPERVLLARAPVDASLPVRGFLDHWRPCIGVFLSGWPAPNLVLEAAQRGVPLALLDGSIPRATFHHWHRRRRRRALFAAMTAAFSLIIPHSDIEVGRFRLLGAALPQMPGWCNDLSYACALSSPVANLWRPPAAAVAALQELLAGRDAWLVCNYAAADEGELVATHAALRAEFPRVLTVYVPADPTRAAAICASFAADGPTTALCTSSNPTSLEGVGALVVDTPWSLQLLMSVCELVYVGPVTLPGDANYTLLSHAALSSCAVVASAAVAAHVQLAQELNNAAVHAAEDTAHAVRGLGVDVDANTPWRETATSPSGSHASGHSSAGATPHRDGASAAAVSSRRSGRRVSVASDGSPAARTPRSLASRGQSGSIPSHPGSPTGSRSPTPRAESPLGRGSPAFSSPAPPPVPGAPHEACVTFSDRCSERTQAADSELHTLGVPSPCVPGTGSSNGSAPAAAPPPPHRRSASTDAASPFSAHATAPPAQTFMRSPAQPPATPSQAGNASSASVSPTPMGLPLSRSPNPLRRLNLRGTGPPPAWPHATSSSGATPTATETPTSLHMSVHRPTCMSLAPARSMPSTPGTLAEASADTPHGAHRAAGLSHLRRTITRSAAAAADVLTVSQVSASPSQRGVPGERCYGSLSGVAHSTEGPSEGGSAVTLVPHSTARGALGGPLRAPESPDSREARAAAQALVEGGAQRRLGADVDAGGAAALSAAAVLPVAAAGLSHAAGKDGQAEGAAAVRSMIGSERPPKGNAPAAGSAAELEKQRPLSPVLPPSTLNRLRLSHNGRPADLAAASELELQRRRTSEAGAGGDAADAESLELRHVASVEGCSSLPRDESMDLWAGASPFMPSSHCRTAGAFAVASADASPSAAAVPGAAAPPTPDAGASPDAGPDSARRVTVRHALLRHQDKFLLSAIQLFQHPEGPAVWLLGRSHTMVDVVGSLLREPVCRHSRGYIAVQAASRLSNNLVSTIWDVLDGSVLEPALLAFEHSQNGGPQARPSGASAA